MGHRSRVGRVATAAVLLLSGPVVAGLVALPAQAADLCPGTAPAPTLASVTPSTVVQWQNLTIAGTSPQVCGKVGVQRLLPGGVWTTMAGVQPVQPSASNTYSLWMNLGFVGPQQIRVFYKDGPLLVFSNAKSVVVKKSPTPAPQPPSVTCADDSPPPQFTSIPRSVTSGATFSIRGYSPRACGPVTLLKYENRQWSAVGVDTPGPLNIVGYRVTQNVPAGRSLWKVTYALRYLDEGDTVYSTQFTVVATR
ncbi:MAG: hypothetical protein R2737_10180 [Candidatus Nanopelagicales bacterium]